MKTEFVNYNQALKLKALGFDEPCFGLYAPPSKTVFLHHYGLLSAKEQILAPLYQQAFRWLRDEHKLHHEIEYNGFEYLGYVSGMTANVFNTYEEAELACLNKLIEIVESKK